MGLYDGSLLLEFILIIVKRTKLIWIRTQQ